MSVRGTENDQDMWFDSLYVSCQLIPLTRSGSGLTDGVGFSTMLIPTTLPHSSSSATQVRPDSFISHTSTLSGFATTSDWLLVDVSPSTRRVLRIGVGDNA